MSRKISFVILQSLCVAPDGGGFVEVVGGPGVAAEVVEARKVVACLVVEADVVEGLVVVEVAVAEGPAVLGGAVEGMQV